MKKFVILGALFTMLALGSFDVAWAGHSITISPNSAPANNTPVTVTVTSTVAFTATPFASITPNPGNAIKIVLTPWTVGTAVATFKVTVPDQATLVGSKTFTVGVGDFCPPFGASTDCASKPFTVTLTGGGGGGGGGGGIGGGGFIEDVPARFGPIPEGPQTGGEFISVVEGLTNWLFVILLVFAVIFIVLAGFQFIAGGGDPQQVAQARTKLIWAAVGIAVALLARGIPAAISNLFL